MAVEKLAFTINETANAIGVGRTKVYNLISEGKIPTIKIGKRTLVPADGLRAFMASLQEAA